MGPDRLANPLAVRWMVGGEWRAHPGRVVVAALAIAIGVALGFAVRLVNLSALDEFARAIHAVSGEADLQVHATSSSGFDETLYPRLARLDGVAAASPVVELEARTGAGGQITLLGLDILQAAQVTPSLIGRPAGASGPDMQHSPFAADALFLSTAALASGRLSVGSPVIVTAAGRSARFTVAGTLPGAGEGQNLAVTDIADAQWRLGQIGRLQRIDLRLAAGVSRARVEAEVRQALPDDAEIVTPQAEARRSDSLSRAYRVNLEMLAMVALLTGGFLVYSAQSLSVARRRSQFALLRVLGLSRRGLLLQIVVEGAVVGLAGAGTGIALGLGLASLALRLLGGDLGGGFFAGSAPELVFSPGAAAVFLALGVAVALAGSLWPAVEAGRAQPAVALKYVGDSVDPRRRPSAIWALVLLVAGGLAALAPPIGGLPILGYGAIALVLAGGIGAMPWLARRVLAPFQLWRDPAPAAHLALSRLWGAPNQAAIALCGIVASTSLMVAMAVMVSSFRGSVDDWLTQILPSDLYLHIEGAEAGGLEPAVMKQLAATPGVARIRFRKVVMLRLAADQPAVALMVSPIDPRAPGLSLPLIGRALTPPAGATPVWLSEPMARIYGERPGDRLNLPLGGRSRPVFVAGIWRDYARQFGAVALDEADYVRLTGDAARGEAAIDLKPGVPAPPVIAALRSALPAGMAAQASFAQPAQIRALALKIFDRSFAVTYALEAIAILVGLTGVAATFSAQTLARTREFGMLRHIGAKRGQIIAMLALEGALLGAVGAVAGLGLGAVMGQILIQVINPQSFHWTMSTRWPLGLFAGLVAALVGASAGTAVLAGRSALSADAVRAVREDW